MSKVSPKWSKEEVEGLQLVVTAQELYHYAKKIGRTPDSVRVKRHKLGLPKLKQPKTRREMTQLISDLGYDAIKREPREINYREDPEMAYVRKLKEAIKAQGLDKPRFVFCKFRNAVRVVEPMWRHV